MAALSDPRPTGGPVPVLALTGFLGAGKTTVLNHLLTEAVATPTPAGAGLRVAAVVNDFGEIEVDATAVAGRVDALVSLANGCLCCEVDASELADALVELADPRHGIDLVVVEASGLAEPSVLARMVHDAPREAVSYGGTVEVVDAEHLEESLERHPRLAAHLADADLVVVNKCDLVSRPRWHDLRGIVRAHAPRVAVVPAVRGAVPTGLLLGLDPAEPRAGGHAHEHEHGDLAGHSHLHDDYSAVSVRPAGPLHPRRFLAAVSAPPAGAYRVKGRLTLATADGPRVFGVALVGRRLELEPLGAPGDTDGQAGAAGDGLVVIGVDLPDTAAGFLDDARLRPGETVDDDDLLGLHPYLVGTADSTDVEEWLYDEQRSTPVTGAATMLADPEDPDTGDPAFTP